MWHCGNAKDRFTIAHIAHHSGFGADGRLSAELQVPSHAGLGSDDCIVTQLRAARKAGLSHDQTMLSDRDIMRDMNQIIELRSRSNYRTPEGGAINCGIRSNFDIVLKDYVSNL